MKKRIILLLLICLLMVTNTGFASHWEYTETFSAADTYKVYVDTDSIAQKGDNITCWTLIVLQGTDVNNEVGDSMALAAEFLILQSQNPDYKPNLTTMILTKEEISQNPLRFKHLITYKFDSQKDSRLRTIKPVLPQFINVDMKNIYARTIQTASTYLVKGQDDDTIPSIPQSMVQYHN